MSSNTKTIIISIIFSSIQSTLSNPTCSQPKLVGKCRALSWRVYYDAETNTCKEFGYGGCGGNDNNFNSAVACVRTCYNLDSEDAITDSANEVKRPGYEKMTGLFQPKALKSASHETVETEQDALPMQETEQETAEEIMQGTIEDLNVLNWIAFAILVLGISVFMIYYLKLRRRKLMADDYVPIKSEN